MTKQETIIVRFSVNEKNIHGTTIEASDENFPMGKIVFLTGYKPERNVSWTGALPKDREAWECQVTRITNEDNPNKGVVFVRLVEQVAPPFSVQRSGLLAPSGESADEIASPLMRYLSAATRAGYVSERRLAQIIEQVSPASDGWSNRISLTTIEGNVPHAGFHKEAEYALGRNYWTVRVTFDRNARPKPENVHDDLVSIGEESCVLDAKKDFMPHPEFEYWDLYDSEKLKRGVYEFIGFRIINIPFINQVFSVIAGGERVLEKAVGTAKAALHYNHKKIWREFWDYGQGWSREPESFGIFPDARVSVHKPNGSTGGARNIADAVITATRAAERWCDTTYTYSRTGEWDSNDNPIYKNEPAIAVYRPEGGNWIVVKEERWKQGEGFVTSEVFRIKCAEGQIRENFE